MSRIVLTTGIPSSLFPTALKGQHKTSILLACKIPLAFILYLSLDSILLARPVFNCLSAPAICKKRIFFGSISFNKSIFQSAHNANTILPGSSAKPRINSIANPVAPPALPSSLIESTSTAILIPLFPPAFSWLL